MMVTSDMPGVACSMLRSISGSLSMFCMMGDCIIWAIISGLFIIPAMPPMFPMPMPPMLPMPPRPPIGAMPCSMTVKFSHEHALGCLK